MAERLHVDECPIALHLISPSEGDDEIDTATAERIIQSVGGGFSGGPDLSRWVTYDGRLTEAGQGRSSTSRNVWFVDALNPGPPGVQRILRTLAISPTETAIVQAGNQSVGPEQVEVAFYEPPLTSAMFATYFTMWLTDLLPPTRGTHTAGSLGAAIEEAVTAWYAVRDDLPETEDVLNASALVEMVNTVVRSSDPPKDVLHSAFAWLGEKADMFADEFAKSAGKVGGAAFGAGVGAGLGIGTGVTGGKLAHLVKAIANVRTLLH